MLTFNRKLDERRAEMRANREASRAARVEAARDATRVARAHAQGARTVSRTGGIVARARRCAPGAHGCTRQPAAIMILVSLLLSKLRTGLTAFVVASVASGYVTGSMLSAQPTLHAHVILGGRVMDPESRLDAVRNIAIDG